MSAPAVAPPPQPTTASPNRPTIAAAVTGAVTALTASVANWAVDVLPAVVPGDVRTALLGVLVLIGALIGTAAGRIAQRHTWAEATVLDRQADWWASGMVAAQRAAQIGEPPPDADAEHDPASGKFTPPPDPIYTRR